MGPALRDIYLRKSGTLKYKGYSPSLLLNFYWTKKKLDLFLEDPEKMFPDTVMFFDGVNLLIYFKIYIDERSL